MTPVKMHDGPETIPPSRVRGRAVAFYALDLLAWVIAIGAVRLFQARGQVDGLFVLSLIVLWLVAALAQLVAGWPILLYRSRYLPGSLEELRAVAGVDVIVGVVLVVVALLIVGRPDASALGLAFAIPLAIVLMALPRAVDRQRREARIRPHESAQRTLIYGAGYLGNHLIRRMLTDPRSQYVPVGILDDDPAKRRLTIEGVGVVGGLGDLARVVEETRATAIIVSIARADAALLRQVSDAGESLNLRVLVFPVLEEVLEGKSRLRDVRDIGIEDLIGRHPVDTQVESMAGYLTGRRVVVTGAGGSIGSELCRQIARFQPARLVLMDRDETGLQSTQLVLEGNGLLNSDSIVLLDIRDARAVAAAFEAAQPEVVFHAAALKHLPMLERYPDEAWKTNVIGTLNVLEAARATGVETFVNISTDKAANPSSVLGHSKRLAERITAWFAEQTGQRYLSVRFGNVIGSRGSLVPVFATMIEAGGPVTVTDPEVTRFFMTIPEACHLVIQAGGIGGPGEVLILDMGQPVRILDVAERMIARSGRDVSIVFTGLRPGEKLNEELMGAGETDLRPIHPKISHTAVAVLDPDALGADLWADQLGGRV